MTQSNETQQKQEDFGQIIKDINIKPIIEEEVRKVRADRDFTSHAAHSKTGYPDLDKIPSVENTLGSNLNEILGKLGITAQKENHESEDS